MSCFPLISFVVLSCVLPLFEPRLTFLCKCHLNGCEQLKRPLQSTNKEGFSAVHNHTIDNFNRPCMISIIMQEQRVSGVRGGRYSNGARHKGNKAKEAKP